MKNITNSKILGYAMLMVAFLIVAAGTSLAPRTASAQWDSYDSGSYYDSGYGSSYDTGYGSSYDSSYYGSGYDSGYGSSYDSGYGSYGSTYSDPTYSSPYGSYDYGCSSCGYTAPTYSYPVTYPSTYTPAPTQYPTLPTPVSPIYISCYPMPLTANVGDSVSWVADVTGGNGTYSYSWSGTDGLSGAGSSLTKVYYTGGSKSATLTVRSGNKTAVQTCSGSAQIYQQTVPPPVYYPPTYPQYPTYSQLSVSCSANTTYTNAGSSVVWSANVSGGNGNYSYSWSGSDGLYGSSQSAYITYNNSGSKYATVTVYSNGQNITQACANTVTVNQPITYVQPTYVQPAYVQPTYVQPTTVVRTSLNGLDIGCYSDPSTAGVNQPVTWSAEATGGVAPYRFSWTGTDGLSGNNSSVTKVYDTAGQKSAIITITSADGKSATHACTNALTVRSNYTGTPVRTTTVTNTTTNVPQGTQVTNGSALSAASLFSLSGIPWGWVAILVILVLFAMVMYLIFNRPRI